MIVTGLSFVPLNRALRNTFSTLKILNLTHRVTYTTQHLCISLVYPLIYVVLPILSYNGLNYWQVLFKASKPNQPWLLRCWLVRGDLREIPHIAETSQWQSVQDDQHQSRLEQCHQVKYETAAADWRIIWWWHNVVREQCHDRVRQSLSSGKMLCESTVIFIPSYLQDTTRLVWPIIS